VEKVKASGGEALTGFVKQHKFCYRFLPLQVFCRTSVEDVEKAAKSLLDTSLNSKPPTTFSILCDVRSCASLSKKDLIDRVAKLVDSKHKVQLKGPETFVLVQVIKSACGLSVVPGAQRFAKSQASTFNLLQMASAAVDAKDQAISTTKG